MISTVLFTLCGIIVVRNMFDFYSPEVLQPLLPMPANLALMATFVLGLLAVATLAFLSSFQESLCAAIAGLVVLGFTLLFWVTVSLASLLISSYTGQPNLSCIHAKCPETLWLVGLTTDSYTIYHQGQTAPPPVPTTPKPLDLLQYHNPYFYPDQVPLINGTRCFYVPFLRNNKGNLRSARSDSFRGHKRRQFPPKYKYKQNYSIITFPGFFCFIVFIAFLLLFLFFACIIFRWINSFENSYEHEEKEDARLRD